MKCHRCFFLAAQAWSTLKSSPTLLVSKTCKHTSEQEGKAGVGHSSGVDFCHWNFTQYPRSISLNSLPVKNFQLPAQECAEDNKLLLSKNEVPEDSVCTAQWACRSALRSFRNLFQQKTTQNSLGRRCFYIVRAGSFMWVAFSDFFNHCSHADDRKHNSSAEAASARSAWVICGYRISIVPL